MSISKNLEEEPTLMLHENVGEGIGDFAMRVLGWNVRSYCKIKVRTKFSFTF